MAPPPSVVRLLLHLAVAALILFPSVLFPGDAAGQSADLEVVLVGEGDQPVVGVLVEVSGPMLAEAQTRVSDGQGRAVFTGLPTGEGYRVRTLHVGYLHTETEPFDLVPGERARHELRLVRQVLGTDTLQVFTSPLRIRREDTEFTARIERRAIELLPTPYSATDLVGLTAGARPGQIWGGAAEQSNAYQLDGLAQTHPGTGGAFVEPSIRWIERLEVRGLGAGAEHGNFQGGLVNVVTRSGSNARTGGLRLSGEFGGLNASNLVPSEVGLRTELRRELEAEAAGPILRDRLYYFVGGHLLEERREAQGHVPGVTERFLPWTQDRLEFNGFGKLTFEPSFRDRFELSGGFVNRRIEHAGLIGYQAPEAAGRLENPTGYYNLSWDRTLGPDHRLEASVAGFHARNELIPPAGREVPGARLYSTSYPPVFEFQNEEYHRVQRPGSLTASLRWDGSGEWGGAAHDWKVGLELSRGRWDDQMTRNGGMTWRPLRGSRTDPENPASWTSAGGGGLMVTEWGGEVDLHSRVANDAVYVQNQITLSPRLSLSPGLRFGRWTGDILPGGDEGARFRALGDTGFDPRLGITLDPTGSNRLVFKGHWGRYHQGMMGQFFDRVAGGGVFTNREIWYYRGDPPADGRVPFTREERDALATVPIGSGQPSFELSQLFRMNEEGPADPNYRQPHVDQWIAGIEAQPTDRIRAELVYVNRANHRMVGLVDRNLLDNYTRYEDVRVFINLPDNPVGVELGDAPLVLPELWIPNDIIRERLVTAATQGGVPIPPGFEFSDTLWLSYEQDLHLQNLDEARRDFHQIQLSVHAGYPRWGASASLVWTQLRGNLNSVTGYEAGTDFEDFEEMGAGPFVRPNEQPNFFGDLPGVSPLELKLSLHGEPGWGLRAGAFLNAARGDRFTPFFNIDGSGGMLYTLEAGGSLGPVLPHGVSGQRLMVRPRGSYRYADRFTLDLRFDRVIPMAGDRFRATLDLFNVWNASTGTEIYPEVNVGTAVLGQILFPEPNQRFGAVRERVPPRTLRLGVTASF